MIKICKHCGKEFETTRGNKIFCERNCKDQSRNDNKPRKTAKSYKTAKLTRDISLTYEQRQIILGGLLGDGSINVNNVLLMTHSASQKEYIMWKATALGGLVQAPASKYTRGNGNEQYHVHTIQHPELTELRKTVYPQGVKTLGEWVHEIDLLGIAIWYMDDGSSMKTQNQCTFSTESFTLDEQTVLVALLKEYGIEATLLTYLDKRYGKYRTRIILYSKAAKKFKRLIAGLLPQCMQYKVK